jgi:hypothetical protein
VRTERNREVVRQFRSALIKRVSLGRRLGAEYEVRGLGRNVGTRNAADRQLWEVYRNRAEILGRRVVREELVVHAVGQVRQELRHDAVRLAAELVLVGRQCEVRRGARSKAATKARFVSADVVIAQHDTRVERQRCIESREHVPVGVLVDDLVARAGTREGVLRGEDVVELIDRRLRHVCVGAADVRPARGLLQMLELRAHEEERLVLYDRAADGAAELLLRVVTQVGLRAREALVARVAEHRAMQLVRSATRHGVDEQAAEVALAHVKRRQQDLILLHGVEGNRLGVRLAARLASRAETEHVA